MDSFKVLSFFSQEMLMRQLHFAPWPQHSVCQHQWGDGPAQGLSASTQLPSPRARSWLPKLQKTQRGSSRWITTEENCKRHPSDVTPVIRYLPVFALDPSQKAETGGFACWGWRGGLVSAEMSWNLVRFYRHGNCSIKSAPLPVYFEGGQISVGIGGRCSLFGNWHQCHMATFSWGNQPFTCSSWNPRNKGCYEKYSSWGFQFQIG